MNTLLRRSFFAVLAAAFFVPSLIIAQPFEGTVTWQTSVPVLGDAKLEMTVSMKGDKSVASTDIPNMGALKTYVDRSAKTMILVQEAQKQGSEMSMDQMDAALNGKKFTEPKATGKKETIKGMAAEEYTSTLDENMEFDLWVTKDLPKDVAAAINASMESSMQLGGMKNEAFNTLFKKGYTPIRTIIKNNGDIQATMEFAKVEPKKLDDKIFVIPSDIKIQKMDPAMMQQNEGSTEDKNEMKQVTPPPSNKQN